MSHLIQVLLISDDQFETGMFKGYFHALGGHLIDISDYQMLLDTLKIIIPDLVFLNFNSNNWIPDENLIQSLIQFSNDKNIPICGLNSDDDASSKVELNIDFDNILLEPVDMTQLDDYIFEKFNHRSSFFNPRTMQERRICTDRRNPSAARRSIDRRSSDTERHEKFKMNDVNNPELGDHLVGPFLVNNKLKCVYFNDKLIPLTNKEFKLFEKLACEADRVVSDEEIIEYLWPGNNHATKADLHQYMYLLRKKIESNPKKPRWISTVKGFGYRIASIAPHFSTNRQKNG